ncbi:CheR family methyltransferase [Fischerella sp. PCC 9605]|uniref:CheR family methyltransferase n=1 Tax=Fischerella sp. PCC 9605 TaxID=1173024 RepID=UPI00047BEF34|nr:CheR family methyltransferase [Fischerella sp. PCC 9605]
MSSTDVNPDLENLLEYIKRNRGFDFRGYKRTSLSRRIKRRMQALGVESYSEYLDYLEVHPDEFVELFNTILINVTGFFRDAEAWEYIASEIIPTIITNKHLSQPIRVWSAGCASGEETYTIAMLLAEALGMEQYTTRVKVFATDVDAEALDYARHANYNPREIQSIPSQLLEKYFERTGGRYVVQKELRRGVIFGRHDLVQDAPISRIDMLVCRNTLMYFNSETQARILDRFHFALQDRGFLFLGKAEMLFTRNHSFTPLDLRRRVFTKVPNGNRRDMLLSITPLSSQQSTPEMVDPMTPIHQAAFEIDPIAQLIVDVHNSLVLANEQARTLFNLNPRDLGRPLQDLEISYRPLELRSRIDQVSTNRRAVILKEVEWSITEQETRYFDVQVIPLLNHNSDELLGVKIVFTDVTRFKQLQHELVHANQELETAYEELQSTNEELETTNEELQSTVEELETTNEELQSTNEELETMNEELQSTNEELHALNDELRQRSDELVQVNTFLESILAGLHSGVAVLNQDLHIQIWNYRAEDLWGVRADEVKGRHFLNLDIGLPVEQLRQTIRACLSGELPCPEVTLQATNRRGRGILCKVSCTPLRASTTRDIQGVILLMEELDSNE